MSIESEEIKLGILLCILENDQKNAVDIKKAKLRAVIVIVAIILANIFYFYNNLQSGKFPFFMFLYLNLGSLAFFFWFYKIISIFIKK